ncbi:MAG: C25 family cysteine peptidase [Candidatus Cloacimonas sp.]
MKATKLVMLILTCMVGILFAESVATDVNPLKVVAQNSTQIKLQLQVPELQIDNLGNSGYKILSMQGASSTAETGYPELPMFSAWVAIPPKGDIEVKVTAGEMISRKGIKPKPVFADKEQETALEHNRTAYKSSSLYPQSNYSYSQPQILRDFRVVQISLNPIQYIAANEEIKICKNMEVEISIKDRPGINEIPAYNGYSYAFTNIYESMISNFAYYRNAVMAPQPARILLIYGNNTDSIFLAKLNEYVTWKKEKGYEVNVVNTSQTGGTSNQAIHNYIQTQYDNPALRPDYIILLGDTSGSYSIPTYTEQWSSYSGKGDYPYTFLAGNDYLGDAFIGRISAENVSQLDVLLAKIYAVEKNINVTGTAASWLNRMLLVGDTTSSGISTIYVNKAIKEMAKRTNSDYTFLEDYTGGFPSYINSGINQGVSFFNYRGYISMSGWNPSSSLINGNKLPHATILTCGTGNFESTATTEEFIRLGTSAAPAGAITAIGMSTSGTHTTFNNCLNAGVYDGIFTYGMHSMGEALLNAKLYLKQIYGSVHDNEANYFSHWCNLMGDPTVEVFTKIPDQFSINCEDVLPCGSNLLDVAINNVSGTAVEGATVTLYSAAQNSIVGMGYTDAEGNVTINISGGILNELILTVSKHNFKPQQKIVAVDGGGSLVYLNKLIVDDGSSGSSGNGDSFAEAGETIAVNLEIKNTTAATIAATTATITSTDPYITILNGQTSFNQVDANASVWSNSLFTFSILPNLPSQQNIRFSIELSTADSSSYNFDFHLSAYNASLVAQSYTISAGGNNILDPGENGLLDVIIKNNSVSPVTDVSAELISLNDLVSITDGNSYVGSIAGNSIGSTIEGFQIYARPILIPGMQIPMRLHLYNDLGFDQFTEFNIEIGQVNMHTPLGPDAYGYFIYDPTDIAFTDCPSYDWTEINPSMGGSGTLITGLSDPGVSGDEGDQVGADALETISLPFTFPFYGIDYNQITVCVNGFITFGITENAEFRNSHLPGGYGPAPMLAPFWDDLCLISDAGIYKYYDSNSHLFIIEYYKMRNGYDRNTLETFQVIFYDPVFYPTSLGDGMVKFQYQDFNNVDVGQAGYSPAHGNYCSIGIKDHTNAVGLEYSYNNQYPNASAPITDQFALLITTAPVLHSNPFIVFNNLIIDDPNSNQIAEPGETLGLGIKLMNIGLQTACQVQLTASCVSSYGSLLVNSSAYNNIPGDSIAVNRTPLSLIINQDCPDGAVITMNIHISVVGYYWDYSVDIIVHRPAVQFCKIYMNDSMYGNNNGLVEPGETIDLVVNMENNSTVAAHNITCTLTSISGYVNIQNSTCILPSIAPDEINQAIYRLVISPDVMVGNNLTLYLNFMGDQIPIQTEPIILSVGTTGMNANFENNNGNFVPNPSTNGWEWGISTVVGAHSGTKVWGTRLESDYPANANYTLTTPSVYIGTDFMLEFWHFYSTEAGYDGGNVKISTNNGSSWTLITPEGNYPTSNVSSLGTAGYAGNSGGWVLARFSLANYSNQTVQFRFTFNSDSSLTGPGWFIDDVRTTGYVEFVGKISGTITSSNANINYDGVRVKNSSLWTTHPDADGYYAIYLPVGSQTLWAEADGYKNSDVAEFVLTANSPILQQNFYLGYFSPVIGLSYSVVDSIFTLIWNPPTEPEFPVLNYQIYRKIDAGNFEAIASTTESEYTETLKNLGSEYYYYVVCLYADGNSVPSDILHYHYIVETNESVNPVLVTKLLNNYPNPFNPETVIRFTLKESALAKICIYNIKGQVVKELLDEKLASGLHQISWNGKDANNRDVASGMYFYRLESGNYSCVKKMLLLK